MASEDLDTYTDVRRLIGMRNGSRRTTSAMLALDITMRSRDASELVRLMQKWLACAPHEER